MCMDVLERRFELAARGTTVRREALAGVTTFLTMAYIIFVQPAVLGAAGMDLGAVLVATCLSTAFATTLMALLANYPIAVAPAMGHNFFFAYTVVLGMRVPWQVALGAVALAGLVFILTAGIGLREHLITAIPASLKHAIAAGIGLLIATMGLEWAGLDRRSAGNARRPQRSTQPSCGARPDGPHADRSADGPPRTGCVVVGHSREHRFGRTARNRAVPGHRRPPAIDRPDVPAARRPRRRRSRS